MQRRSRSYSPFTVPDPDMVSATGARANHTPPLNHGTALSPTGSIHTFDYGLPQPRFLRLDSLPPMEEEEPPLETLNRRHLNPAYTRFYHYTIGVIVLCEFALVTEKQELIDFNRSLSTSILSNMFMFFEDEVLHILACAEVYKHEQPLSAGYKAYCILAQAVRLPFFHYVVQPQVGKLLELGLDDQNNRVLNMVLMLLAHLALLACSVSYSELIRPRVLIEHPKTQTLFFRRMDQDDDLGADAMLGPYGVTDSLNSHARERWHCNTM